MQIKFEVGSRKLKEFKLDGLSFLCVRVDQVICSYFLPLLNLHIHSIIEPCWPHCLKNSWDHLLPLSVLPLLQFRPAWSIPSWVPATANYPPPFQTPPYSLHTAVRVLFLKQIWSYHTTASNDLVTPLFLSWIKFFHMTCQNCMIELTLHWSLSSRLSHLSSHHTINARLTGLLYASNIHHFLHVGFLMLLPWLGIFSTHSISPPFSFVWLIPYLSINLKYTCHFLQKASSDLLTLV